MSRRRAAPIRGVSYDFTFGISLANPTTGMSALANTDIPPSRDAINAYERELATLVSTRELDVWSPTIATGTTHSIQHRSNDRGMKETSNDQRNRADWPRFLDACQ